MVSEPNHLNVIKRRALFSYEAGRLKAAFLASLFLVPCFALMVFTSPKLKMALLGTALAWAFAIFALWRGLSLGRGVLPGIVCALFPLITSHLAARIGHLCLGDGCYGLCAPLCVAGGAAAGIILAQWIKKDPRPTIAFISGAVLVLAVGSTGCTCIGFGGIGGIFAGLSVGWLALGLKKYF